MKSDFTYDQKREWAKTLYTKQNQSISDVAATIGADEVIVRSWIHDGNWNDIRHSTLISKEMQIQRAFSAIDSIHESAQGKLTAKDVDLINKYTNWIKNLESETGVSYIVQVAELFTTWLLHRDADLARVVTAQFEAFITEQDITRPKPII